MRLTILIPRPVCLARRLLISAAVIATCCALNACDRRPITAADPSAGSSAAEAIAMLPVAPLAGGTAAAAPAQMPNPLQGQQQAIAEGHRLFEAMNCAGCHGYQLAGAMGPNLTDTYWRYGGTPAAIFQTIFSGRPQGMPAWRDALSAKEIWELVAYIEKQGGTVPAAQYSSGLSGDLAEPAKPPPPPAPPKSG